MKNNIGCKIFHEKEEAIKYCNSISGTCKDIEIVKSKDHLDRDTFVVVFKRKD